MVPGSLLAVASAWSRSVFFGLDDHGVTWSATSTAGCRRSGLPDLGFGDYVDLAGPAVGVMLVGFAEGLGAAKNTPPESVRSTPTVSCSARRRQPGSGLSGGMVVNAPVQDSRQRLGRRTAQVSGLVVAALTVITLLLLTGLFEKLPEATLAPS